MAAKTTTDEPVVDSAAVNEPSKAVLPTQQVQAKPSYAIAKTDLYVHGVRAHAAGDRVPTENVERNGWGDLVKTQG